MIPFGTFPLLAAHARMTLPLYLMVGAQRLAQRRRLARARPQPPARPRAVRRRHRPETAR